jgi:hypothetical protein
MGIEPTSEAWEAPILPLYDARSFLRRFNYTNGPSARIYGISDTFLKTIPFPFSLA